MALSPLVYTVSGLNPSNFTLDGTNTYVVGSGARRLLVDTGQGVPQYLEDLKRAVSDLRAEALQAVVLTHSHSDHIGGAEDILKAWGPLPIFKSREETEPDALRPYIQHLCDGQEIRTEGATLRVILTPGHKEDHVCLLLEEENALFTGDLILGRGSTSIQHYTDYKASMRKIQALRPAKLYPGHGDVPVPGAKIAADLAHRATREQQVLAVLTRSPQLLGDIVDAVYGPLPDDLKRAATTNTLHYLSELVQRGDAIEDSAAWRTPAL